MIKSEYEQACTTHAVKPKYEAPFLFEINDRTAGAACSNGSGDNVTVGCTNGNDPKIYYPGHGWVYLGCGSGNGVHT